MKCYKGKHVQDVYSVTTINCLGSYNEKSENFNPPNDAENGLKKFLKRFFGSHSASKIKIASDIENVLDKSCQPDTKLADDNMTTLDVFYDALLFSSLILLFVGLAYLNYVTKF